MIGRNRIIASQDAFSIQYANGKSMARRTIGTGKFMPYTGIHVEIGKDAEIDEAMRAAKVPQIELKHQRQGGAEIIRHWCLSDYDAERWSVRFYPVTAGPVAPTMSASLSSERTRRLTREAGLGARWGEGPSKLAVRGYLDVLVRVGCTRLGQLSVRSRMTDELLRALDDHRRICEAVDSIIDRTRHPEVVAFHELALPLGPGQEQTWGKGGDTAQIYPLVSYHPPQVDEEYLRSIWRPDGVHSAAYRDWESIQLWAEEYASQEDEPRKGPQRDDQPPQDDDVPF